MRERAREGGEVEEREWRVRTNAHARTREKTHERGKKKDSARAREKENE